jgi:hypothetical protein
LTHSLKAPGFISCAYEVKNRFQAFAFKCNLYRYIADRLVASIDAHYERAGIAGAGAHAVAGGGKLAQRAAAVSAAGRAAERAVEAATSARGGGGAGRTTPVFVKPSPWARVKKVIARLRTASALASLTGQWPGNTNANPSGGGGGGGGGGGRSSTSSIHGQQPWRAPRMSLVRVGTFHHVILQSKHIHCIAHVTNLTPGSANPSRWWKPRR